MSSKGSEERRDAHRIDMFVLLCFSTSLRMIFLSSLSDVTNIICWFSWAIFWPGSLPSSDSWPKIRSCSIIYLLIVYIYIWKGKTLNNDYDLVTDQSSSSIHLSFSFFLFLNNTLSLLTAYKNMELQTHLIFLSLLVFFPLL